MPTTPTASARIAKGGGVASKPTQDAAGSDERGDQQPREHSRADLHRAASPRRHVLAETPASPLARCDESGCDQERQNDEPSGDYCGSPEKHLTLRAPGVEEQVRLRFNATGRKSVLFQNDAACWASFRHPREEWRVNRYCPHPSETRSNSISSRKATLGGRSGVNLPFVVGPLWADSDGPNTTHCHPNNTVLDRRKDGAFSRSVPSRSTVTDQPGLSSVSIDKPVLMLPIAVALSCVPFLDPTDRLRQPFGNRTRQIGLG